MNEFIEYLKSVGPFTTPVCIVLTLGMWWLEKDRGRILAELRATLLDARDLRERRADDLAKAVKDYQENAVALREALNRLTAAVQGVGRGR